MPYNAFKLKVDSRMTIRSNFRFIETGIDVAPFLNELQQNDNLWGMVAEMDGIGGDRNPYGFLPLTMGVQFGNISVKDTENQADTPAKKLFPYLNNWLAAHGFNNHSRAAFFRLCPYGEVKTHIDDGIYYKTRNRFHLSLSGEYDYTVDGETHRILPGTFFWFDNKKPHGAVNKLNQDRITFVFDVPK